MSTPSPPMPPSNHHDHKQLINLFPLHPENLVEQDHKLDEDHNMASIFSSCDDATTLTGILCSQDDANEETNTNKLSPSSVNYADEEVELVRTAMRRNKTDKNIDDHEKWVCYSEISSSSSTTKTSCYPRNNSNSNNNNNQRSKLVLKLDYEKIMKSWVNKGPFFIHDDSSVDASYPQTVPDLQDDDFFLPSSINIKAHDDKDDGANEGSWTVPEMAQIGNHSINIGDDALQAGESSATAPNREASVQRYKEKRRNRLFAKTVRYEVRKLNAQKRPRIKGRFVKSS